MNNNFFFNVETSIWCKTHGLKPLSCYFFSQILPSPNEHFFYLMEIRFIFLFYLLYFFGCVNITRWIYFTYELSWSFCLPRKIKVRLVSFKKQELGFAIISPNRLIHLDTVAQIEFGFYIFHTSRILDVIIFGIVFFIFGECVIEKEGIFIYLFMYDIILLKNAWLKRIAKKMYYKFNGAPTGA